MDLDDVPTVATKSLQLGLRFEINRVGSKGFSWAAMIVVFNQLHENAIGNLLVQ